MPMIMTNVERYHGEERHIARRLEFPKELAPYIDWESVARTARELAAHLDARYHQNGACTVTLWWDDDAPAECPFA